MFALNLAVWTLLGCLCLVDGLVIEKRLTRSKLDQFSGPYCDGNGQDSSTNRISSNVNIKSGTCIDIDGKTHSIFLARGSGLVWRRSFTAYAQTGCPSNERITSFQQHDSGSACMNVDSQMLGLPGSQENQGRIMSVWVGNV